MELKPLELKTLPKIAYASGPGGPLRHDKFAHPVNRPNLNRTAKCLWSAPVTKSAADGRPIRTALTRTA